MSLESSPSRSRSPIPPTPAPEILLAAIVDSSDDAIVSKDLDGVVTSWNRGAERLYGYLRDEALGRPISELVLPADRIAEETGILERIRRGERIDHFETVRRRKTGELIDVSVTISPVRTLDGKIVGASKIARNITEVKRTAAEREQLLESERSARASAEYANRMKDEFLATVSHELRTPLNAIVGWTELLKTSTHDPQEVANGVEVIERNAFIQAQLIEDLLDLGRISSGKMTLQIEPIDLVAVAQEAIASVQHAADVKRIAITTDFHGVRGAMSGDAKRLRQVIWNLLTNAIKFTPEGGHVDVMAKRASAHVEIVVADSGHGIAPEFLPHVFERFRQADSSITRKAGGLGIGLALVKQLIELHGGTVRAASAGLGKGATFTLTVPVLTGSGSREISVGPAEVVAPPALADLQGVKVLAVDDDRDSLDVLRRILTGRRAEVRTAGSTDEAMQMFECFGPDVLLSDIGMPGKDGYELIRRVRRMPGGNFVPAAALTALARTDDRMRALQAGFQTHVPKPVAAAEIVAVVRSLASLHPRHQAESAVK